MFILDDILLRAVGVSLPPFDLLWIIERIKDFAEQQRYNVAEIADKIKENQLLFELGEISKAEHATREAELMTRWQIALEKRKHIELIEDVGLI